MNFREARDAFELWAEERRVWTEIEEEVLSVLKESQYIMRSHLCGALDLQSGSTYAEGVAVVQHRRMMASDREERNIYKEFDEDG